MRTVFNPDEAYRFAAWLQEESGNVMIDLRNTDLALTQLQANWNDPKYDAYMRTYEENTQKLLHFQAHAEAYISYLRGKAAIVADYLR